MKTAKIIYVAMISGLINNAYAATQCETKAYNNDCNSYGTMGSASGCSNYTEKCYYFNANAYRHLIDCTSCFSGYTLKTQHPTDNCSGSISYRVCESNSGGGGNISCTWQACVAGNQMIEECVWNNRTYGYRCQANTYGNPTSCGQGSCTWCPENGKSDPNDNIDITRCYQPANKGMYSHHDSFGYYELSDKCYYTK